MNDSADIAFSFIYQLHIKFNEGLEEAFEAYEFNRFKETIKERKELDKISCKTMKINRTFWDCKIIDSKNIYLLHPLYISTNEKLELLNNNSNVPYEEGLKQLVHSRTLSVKDFMAQFVKNILIDAYYFPLSNYAVSSLAVKSI